MSAPSLRLPLEGRGVVVTRPAHQARSLVELIRAAGGNPILFPTLEIADVADTNPLDRAIDRLDEFDLAIFVSPNAVHKAMTRIAARRGIPAGLRFVTVGRGSRKELESFGVTDVIVPLDRFDSEALLDLPELRHVQGRRIVIFRGEGGRELLGDTLAARGASLEYATCYLRRKPECDASRLMEEWAGGRVHAVIVTSSEGVRNLFDMVGEAGRNILQNTPTFVPHPRIAAAARELGLKIVLVGKPGDENMVASLVQFFTGP